jgi:hypothetical protein
MLGGIIDTITGSSKQSRLKGTVVLMRKNVLDLNDFGATVIDGLGEFLGKGVTCQLISSTAVDPSEHTPPPLSPPCISSLGRFTSLVHFCPYKLKHCMGGHCLASSVLF